MQQGNLMVRMSYTKEEKTTIKKKKGKCFINKEEIKEGTKRSDGFELRFKLGRRRIC